MKVLYSYVYCYNNVFYAIITLLLKMAESWLIALITTGGGVITSLCAYWAKKRFNRKITTKISKKILKNHYIFSQVNYWQNEMIPQTKFGDEGRNAIIHDFLEIVLTNTANILKDFIKNKLNNNNQEESHALVIIMLFQIKNETESISVANGIPEKFIEKYIDNDWDWEYFTTWDFKTCITEEFIKKYKNKSWNWYDLFLWGNTSWCKENRSPFSLEFIEKYFDKNWNWKWLSRHMYLTTDFVEKYIDKKWDWSVFSEKGCFPRFAIKSPENKNGRIIVFRQINITLLLYNLFVLR